MHRGIGRTIGPLFIALAALAGVAALGADWPMWRHDARRSASTRESLPARPALRWVRSYPPLEPAWPDEPRMPFDAAYEPVAAGGMLFVASSREDTVTAIDAETGAERWRFFADGPVRFAPAVWEGGVHFVSDDGFLYRLDAATGELTWRVRGGPSDRKVLGNGRLISAWPARGGPVIVDGTVYFAAGIWPFEGIFIHAVDARTGARRWTNDGCGAMYIRQPHNSPAFAGVAPQGYLAAIGDELLVPCGRSVPACFDRRTGAFRYYRLAAYGKTGGSTVVAVEGGFINAGVLFHLQTGKRLAYAGTDPLVAEGTLYVRKGGAACAFDLRALREVSVDDKGVPSLPKGGLAGRWALRSSSRIFIRAGNRLFAGRDGRIEAIAIPGMEGAPRVVWQAGIEGTPASMLAAGGKLFVVTREGRIACFGGAVARPRIYASKSRDPDVPAPRAGAARGIVAATGVREGICYLFGIGTGRVAEALARTTDLRIIAIDPDAAKVADVRRRLQAGGLYGARIAAHAGDPLAFGLPPYLASLIVSEDPVAAGLDRGVDFVRGMYRVLRPHGGKACLAIPPGRRAAFSAWISDASLPGARIGRSGALTLIVREGAPSGAADWTHPYADSANTCVSRDTLVRAPLGLLWFGGVSNRKILPRHGHGPSEQVVGGRLFIEGPDLLQARDVYTGRVLWEAPLAGVGRIYDRTSHQPGANAVGGNYVSARDGIYVRHGAGCLRLDPETGERLATFRIPTHDDGAVPPTVGYLAIWEDLLVAGASPQAFAEDYSFRTRDFRDASRARSVAAWIRKLRDFDPIENKKGEGDDAFVAANLNRLVDEKDLVAKLPRDGQALRRVRGILEAIDACRKRFEAGAAGTRRRLRKLNRKLLATYYPKIPEKDVVVGAPDTWSGTASRELVVMNRSSGEILWRREASSSFPHNGIAVAAGKVFLLDRLPEGILAAWKRRGRAPASRGALLALDARTGAVLWSTREDVFGTWLAYSEPHDILLQAARASRDMLPEPGARMIAYRGTDGDVLWDRPHKYGGPCMLHGDTIITQGKAFHLLTGEPRMRRHPLTGVPIPWTFARNYGCNTAVASAHLITFRSAAAGYFDLTRDGGTANLGGFRSGCSANLIAAGGVLNAPDYTRTCTCSYPNQTSLALVHQPDGEIWTFLPLKAGEEPVRRVGLNLGAPGDRMADDGTLWLDYPSVGGPSPDIPVEVAPAAPTWFRHHSSRIEGDGLRWVAASGAVGIRELAITLDPKGGRTRPYTVRLHFAEPDAIRPGERVFDVAIAGRSVLEGLDIARVAGPRRTLVETFPGIDVKGKLIVALRPAASAPACEPIICGIEAVAEGW